MAAKKKKPETKGADASGSTRSLRDDAEKQLARSRKISTDLAGQTPEQLNHELRVHQIELEMQAEELRNSKIALEESRDKYLDLYEFAPVGYLTLTDKGIITDANLTGATLLGVERSTLIRAPLSKFIAEKDSDTWHRYFVNVRQQDHQQTCTLTLIRGDNSVFPARLESIRLTGSEGVATVLVAISDITEICRAEEALVESEERLRTILHSIQTGIIVIDAHTHTILDANQKSLDMIGGTKETVLGTVCHNYICPAELGKCPITDLAQTIDNSERFLISTQGKKIQILKSVIPTILRGKKVLIESFIDITDRKRAEEEIKRSFERFKAVMDGLEALVYVVDMKTFELLFINKYGKDIWGEIESQTCWKTIQSGQSGPCPFCMNDRLVDSNGNPTGVYQWEFQNTVTRKWYDCRDSAIRWLDGHLVRLEIATDITERKQAEDTIALTTRKLTLMNDVTYQYIQNKVTAVRGYTEISKDVKTKAERLSFIEKEEHILADIHQLIKNTREYQEIGLILPRWIPVEQSIRIAVSLVSPKQNIPIETALRGLELYTDPLIEKIFANLIENAIIHGKTLTRIKFSCDERPDRLIIICEDDGVGISSEIKTHLFDRSVGEKIHFGLFFVRECLLLSGMTIAETGEPGKGARFEITVPKGAYRFGRPEG